MVVTVSAYMLTLTFATVLTVANAMLSVYVLPLTVLTTTLSFNGFNGCKCKA